MSDEVGARVYRPAMRAESVAARGEGGGIVAARDERGEMKSDAVGARV
jgi:hypothetical protein